jgi:predicted P-loop ATPase
MAQSDGIRVSVEITAAAVEKVSRERPFHPVRDYFNGLLWDRTPRLDTWPCTYLGADMTAYHEAVGTKALIAAVARIYQPGCKADHVPILEGPRGLGKSSAIRALATPWFSDDIRDLGSKDSAMQVAGVLIVELAELTSLTRA